MEQTIKQDRERNIIKSELLNDNTLLEYELKDGKIIVGVRFISSPREMKEQILLIIEEELFKEHGMEIIQISEAKDAIAVFRVAEDNYYLLQVYDTVRHEYGIPEFLDLEYQKRFPSHPLKNQYRKERKKKEG